MSCKQEIRYDYEICICKTQATTQSDVEFVNSLFRTTAELVLKSRKKNEALASQISEVQIQTLIEIIGEHLDKTSTQNSALFVLKNVIKMKIVNTKVYDIVESYIQPQLL